ncbi:methylated-DNA--[protein]-cysteine S-methyltransferase [Gordonia humi]
MTTTPLRWAGTDTPDGRFTAIFDVDGTVYASGWTDDPAYLETLIAPALRTDEIVEGDGADVITAVDDYYSGDLAAPSRIAVTQQSGPFLTSAWAALREVPAGPPGHLHPARRTRRERRGRPRRGIVLCAQRRRTVRAVPPGGPVRRDPRRLPLRVGREAITARSGGRRLTGHDPVLSEASTMMAA